MNPFLWLIHTPDLAVHLSADRRGRAVVADRVQCREQPKFHRPRDLGFPLPRDRAGPAADPCRPPNLGGIDISPVILIIALMFLDQLIIWLFVSVFG
jgi:hypothetical protein